LAAGLLQPASGKVQSGAAALSDANLALDRELTLARALAFWSALIAAAEPLDHALEAFGIAHLRQVPVRLLSTGQAKRASLARVASSSAPLWLLDEPLNGLDTEGAERLASAIARHRQAGGAVVAASHVPLIGEWRHLDLGT
jgi:heme exporter protein A